MSSYNKNQFEKPKELLSNSNSLIKCPLHPLANEPTAVLQGMDYKDWLVMGQQRSGEPELMVEVKDGLSAAINVVAAIVAFSNPVTAAGLAIIGTVLPVLWPENEESVQGIWKDFMNSTEKLIDEKIEKVVRNSALSTLEGLQEQLKNYAKFLKDWLENPSDQSFGGNVGDYFENTHSAFLGAMPHFKSAEHEILLLPVYAQAANLHLLLLRDAAIYGKEWGFPQSEIDLYYKLQSEYTEKYINHCVKWYNKGLKILKNRPNKLWHVVNKYHRNMTIKVLDTVALFSNYDTSKYPVEKNNPGRLPKLELTREIYTLLDSIANLVDVEEAERSLTRKPHLFTWLDGLQFYTKKTTTTHIPPVQCLSDIKNFYHYTYNNQSNNSKDDDAKRRLIFSGLDIYKLKTQRHLDKVMPSWGGDAEVFS
ncbi:insecticidal delta-endotoxin Cry8Ea1 family protein [Bacillus cereus]